MKSRLISSVIIWLIILSGMTGLLPNSPENVGIASAEVLYVGAAVPESYATIQSAIDDAEPGDTVFVYPGNYNENIIINKSINLVGQNKDTTIINGTSYANLITVTADWVNISSLKFVNTSQYYYNYYAGIEIIEASNCYIYQCSLFFNYFGISVRSSSNVTIDSNSLYYNNYCGVRLIVAQNITISNNLFVSKMLGGRSARCDGQGPGVPDYYNYFKAVYMYNCENVLITKNTIRQSLMGLDIQLSSTVTILKNKITGSMGPAMNLWKTVQFNIFNNEIKNNQAGISLQYCENGCIRGNSFINDSINFLTQPWMDIDVKYFDTHTITQDNLVNGKPLYYYKDRSGLELNNTSMGQLIVVNCIGVTVSNLTISNSESAVQLILVDGAVIKNNKIISNIQDGITSYHSSNVTFRSNNISDNGWRGLFLYQSDNATVFHNCFLNNGWCAVDMEFSVDVELIGNNFTNNHEGISIYQALRTTIHHNNFINSNVYYNNFYNAEWDNDYPSGGNYWDKNQGVDNHKGSEQNVKGGDGISDTSYGSDGYPLMKPYTVSLPEPPSKVQAEVDHNYIKLTWELPDTTGDLPINKIKIYRGTTPEEKALLAEVKSGSGYPDTSVSKGITYYYQLSAENMVREVVKGDEVSVIIVTKPSAPRNLSAVAGDSFINLSWDTPDFNGGSEIIEYILSKRIQDNHNSYQIEPGNVTNYVDYNVVNGETYIYRIQARNIKGDSKFSVEVSATPKTIPSCPVGLTATPGEDHIGLSWDTPSSDGGSTITHYRIYKGIAPGVLKFRAKASALLFYKDTQVTEGVTYYYNISAVNAEGESAYTDEVNATIVKLPSKPVQLAIETGDSFINITWRPPDIWGGSSKIRYWIYRSTVSGENFHVASAETAVLFYNDTDVTNGIAYYYKIKAVNEKGAGAFSEEVSGTPQEPVSEHPVVIIDTGKKEGEAPFEVSFDGTLTDPQGKSVTYEWDFGDGDTSTEENPVHTYDKPGEYLVTLTVTDENGQITTTTFTVNVLPADSAGFDDNNDGPFSVGIKEKADDDEEEDEPGALSRVCGFGLILIIGVILIDRLVFQRMKRVHRGKPKPKPKPKPRPPNLKVNERKFPDPIQLKNYFNR
ncbi:MAG: right-handed parallel beta-helix repeat-containing protein [Thermoplasmata archaeon]|nr:MAG: right-handed parallel beta-helix repeat-containing protein [Thermoplasmata archaeon]